MIKMKTNFLLFGVLAVAFFACGGGDVDVIPTEDPACAQSFDTTFEAIEEVVFVGNGCTVEQCHGSAQTAGLDLRPGQAWESLFDVPAQGSNRRRVVPGSPNRSELYLKLLAGAGEPLPGRAVISGRGMPVGGAPVPEEQIEVVRKWIEVGASKEGVIGDNVEGNSESLGEVLGVCLPPSTPIGVTPLAVPAVEEGVQLAMPPYVLEAASEVEVCFASYYDFTEQVPERYKTPDGKSFYINQTQLRMDPHSHHYVLTHSGLDESWVDHPAWGRWTCFGGAREGTVCDPVQADACGEGMCASEAMHTVACAGFGPPELPIDVAVNSIGGPSREGYFAERPLKGILIHNLHGFNLAGRPHAVNARTNLYFTDDRRYLGRVATDSSNVFKPAGQPPFTEQIHCGTHVAPADEELYRMTSHTHALGGYFWVEDPDGNVIYESFHYADPVMQDYDPPLRFPSSDPARRTLRYCAVYNNGVTADGEPDPYSVTRASNMPERAACTPIACTKGQIGASCRGVDDDATCDSSPGAGDGECDACAITAGVTTKNEMFILIPFYGKPVAGD